MIIRFSILKSSLLTTSVVYEHDCGGKYFSSSDIFCNKPKKHEKLMFFNTIHVIISPCFVDDKSGLHDYIKNS